jgi:ATP-dependent Clp protease ATP-binding subunit ClpA
LNIARKKLKQLADGLVRRSVELTFSDEAVELLKNKGITNSYGARELDRIISAEIKPLLVEELLFGKLKNGGKCKVDSKDGEWYFHKA